MGICNSTESISVSTIKVIHQDGKLTEFSYPVKVSQVLQKNPSCFVCNSDEMEFNDFVLAMKGDEHLQPGQLYFVFPLTRLKYPIQAEEMAALAVKATTALTKNGVVGISLGYSSSNDDEMSIKTSGQLLATVNGNGGGGGDGDGGVVVVKRRSKCSGGRGGKRCNFTSKLSAIQE
ncbi:hypothetical protein AQUCO_00700114v1 [Aquilegia coerulea]|uniref:Hth-type transcriptional regulator n=1 Tax=Aquilegia coerulea TaxID=218851 RepID=A0A2G5EIR6_AQUCA|nr:hypothetical protein AQUCO_00700114v1 [Aquilegia coerulea]